MLPTVKELKAEKQKFDDEQDRKHEHEEIKSCEFCVGLCEFEDNDGEKYCHYNCGARLDCDTDHEYTCARCE